MSRMGGDNVTCKICRETLKPGERIVCKECRPELERKVAEELRKVVRKVG